MCAGGGNSLGKDQSVSQGCEVSEEEADLHQEDQKEADLHSDKCKSTIEILLCKIDHCNCELH